jgi:hypothetical protein
MRIDEIYLTALGLVAFGAPLLVLCWICPIFVVPALLVGGCMVGVCHAGR